MQPSADYTTWTMLYDVFEPLAIYPMSFGPFPTFSMISDVFLPDFRCLLAYI